MFLRLLAAFILVPLIELYLLFRLAEATSPLMTIAIVVITGIIGSALARREGVMAWFRFRSALAEGRMPSREIQDGLMIVFAAALLLTPGLLTDTLGFTLLVPVGREFIRKYLLPRFVGNIQVVGSGFGGPQSGQQPGPQASANQHSGSGPTIDASFKRKTD